MSDAVVDDAGAASNVEAKAAYARYTRVAMLLHWVIAAAILFQIWSGWSVHETIAHGGASVTAEAQESAAVLLQTHKSIGLVVLALSLLRLAWRLANPTPPLPAGMPGWQRFASSASHALLYGAMIGAPLMGWIYASASGIVVRPEWVRLYEAPLLPWLPELESEAREAIAGVSRELHGLIAWGMAILLILHVLAALKHHFVDRDAVLARMTPGLQPKSGLLVGPIRGVVSLIRRLGALGIAALAVIAIIAVVFAINRAREIDGDGPSFEADVAGASTTGAGASRSTGAGLTEGGATAQRWAPVYEESSVVVEMTVSDTPADVMLAWTGDIAFDPDDLAGSAVTVVFDMTEARTAHGMAQETMTGPAWLDVANHPTASFAADRFEAGAEDGAFVAYGELTLRDVSQPIELPFTLEIDGDRAVMAGRATINRLDFGVGAGLDDPANPPAELDVVLDVVANRAE